jgi:hypothetical protein
MYIMALESISTAYFINPSDLYVYSESSLGNSKRLPRQRIHTAGKVCLGPRQRNHSWFESHRTHDHILLAQIRDSPNLEGQVTVFVSLRNRMCSLSVFLKKEIWVNRIYSTLTENTWFFFCFIIKLKLFPLRYSLCEFTCTC